MNPLRSILSVITVLSSSALPLLSKDLVFKSVNSDAILMELYSSEGCSSCPPAESWVSQLKTSPELWIRYFPVAFHVDYWDNLGWPDRFAKATYTQRQRDYAARLSQDSVYTPEFVVNGREWRGWFHDRRLPGSSIHTRGELTLVRENSGTVSTTFSPGPEAAASYTVNFALLGVNILSDVRRGENGGHELQHDFVVLNFKSVPMISKGNKDLASNSFDFKSTTADVPSAIVAWVSTSGGTIAQVTGGWINDAGR